MIEDDPKEIVGAEVLDRDGHSLGTTAEVVAIVPGGGLLVRIDAEFLGQPTRTVVAPASSFDGSVIRLPFDRATIDAGPVLDSQFSTAELHELVRYYSGSLSAHPVVLQNEAPMVSVLRSEEHIDARTTVRAHTLVRLRKVIVVEEQTITVPVRRETLVVERVELDPETGAMADGSLPGWAAAQAETTPEYGLYKHGQILVETTLHEDRAVVTTEVVAVETARLRIAVDHREERVSAEVRSEHVEVTDNS